MSEHPRRLAPVFARPDSHEHRRRTSPASEPREDHPRESLCAGGRCSTKRASPTSPYPGFEDGALAPGAHTSPSQWVCALAYLKAWAKAQETPDATVIGADTVCVLDGQVVGTPTDAWEAEQMLRSFVGREHDVITGVAIISRGADRTHRRIFHERATVRWGMIPDEVIASYVATGEWQGKAGGYNLRDRTGAGWPITYSGDPHTIMGLPVEALRRHLSTMARPEQDAARV